MRRCRWARILGRCRIDFPSWPGLTRPSTPSFAAPRTWMPGTSPGMTRLRQLLPRLTRRTRVLDDRSEQLPALTVELHHLHLLVDAIVVRPGADLDAGQREARRVALDAGDLLHDVLTGQIVAALLQDLHQ